MHPTPHDAATFREPSFPPIEKCISLLREIMTIQDFHGTARRRRARSLTRNQVPRDKFAPMKFPRCLYDPFLRSLLPSQLAPSIRRVPRLEEPIHLVSRLANLWTSYAIIKPNVRENL